jgi:hypothetical protein
MNLKKIICICAHEGYLISGLNDIEIRARNIIGEQEFYLDTFNLGLNGI